jgi:hypothetical protein
MFVDDGGEMFGNCLCKERWLVVHSQHQGRKINLKTTHSRRALGKGLSEGCSGLLVP